MWRPAASPNLYRSRQTSRTVQGAFEMNMGHETELFARELIRERLKEAERGRIARPAAIDRERGRPWRARLTRAIVRRLGRVAEAS
jgi:hypothetical protein